MASVDLVYRGQCIGSCSGGLPPAHVRVEGRERVGVAEDVGDLSGREPGLVQERGECLAEGVEGHPLVAGPVAERDPVPVVEVRGVVVRPWCSGRSA